VTWKKAVTVDDNPETYSWTPSVAKSKTKCKVKVVLKDDKGVALDNDVSDGVFTINP
jgi:hypothetical protein